MSFGYYVLVALGAYLLGSLPTGYLFGKSKGVDIRKAGSGNIGATNVFRLLGPTAGVSVLLVDFLKGFLACGLWVKLVWLLAGTPADAGGNIRERLSLVAGVCAILGHNYTCWLGFKGGKGVATTAGVMLAWLPGAFAIALATWGVTLAIWRIMSLASMAGAVALPVAVWLMGGKPLWIAVAAFLGVLAIYRHRSNIQRLLKGTEPKIGAKKP